MGGWLGRVAPTGAWQEYVRVRVRTLRSEFEALDLTQAQEPHRAAALEHLDQADAFVDDTSRPVRDWFSGRRVEGAWFAVHHAESILLTLLPPAKAAARIPFVAAVARSYLPPRDPHRLELERRYAGGHAPKTIPDADREFLADTARSAYFHNAIHYGRVRGFRNVLLIATLALTTLMALVIGFGASLPVCFEKTDEASTAETTKKEAVSETKQRFVCPTGTSSTGPELDDLLLLGLVGLVGAGLAAARSLTTGEDVPTRYSTAIAQALLKLPIGVGTAIFGLVALEAGFVPGVDALDTQGEIVIWALILGFSQQVLTGLLDKRGQSLLSDASPTTEADDPT